MKRTAARRGGTLAVVATLAIVATACSGGGAENTDNSDDGGGGGAGDNSGYTIAMVTHETPGDTFWDKIKSGAEQAAKRLRHRPEVLQRP